MFMALMVLMRLCHKRPSDTTDGEVAKMNTLSFVLNGINDVSYLTKVQYVLVPRKPSPPPSIQNLLILIMAHCH